MPSNRYKQCPTCGKYKLDITDNLWYCYYCGRGGYLSDVDNLRFSLENRLKPKNNKPIEIVATGSYTKRLTRLKVNVAFALNDLWDAFDTYSPKEEPYAKVLRRMGQEPKALVESGLPVGVSYVKRPSSTYKNPITIVEGVYDVLRENDVCIHGSLRYAKLKEYFTAQYVVLQPDGDVWLDKNKSTKLLNDIDKLHPYMMILGVNYIPNGLDIDEIDYSMVQYVEIKHVREFINEIQRES